MRSTLYIETAARRHKFEDTTEYSLVTYLKYAPFWLLGAFFKISSAYQRSIKRCKTSVLQWSHIILATLLVGCLQPRAEFSASGGEAVEFHYAKGLEITKFDGFYTVQVRDPWNEGRILHSYLLIPRGETLPEPSPQGTVIRTPIERATLYSSVHTAIIEMLGAEEHIVAAAEVQYINSPRAERLIKEGKIADIGMATSPNIEKIIESGSDAIICSPFKDAGYGPAEKVGVPMVECADYMESHPLGRVEWVRLFGLLLDREAEADSILRATVDSYLRLKELAKNVTERPTLLAERKYGSQWYVPGGESHNGVMFADAGADYIFATEHSAGSVPMAFETVLDRAIDADIWLFKYNSDKDLTYATVAADYQPYTNFRPFKKRHIYVCNTGKRPYYEEIVMHPDWLLEDYIHIFHPELLEGHQLRYFEPLAE